MGKLFGAILIAMPLAAFAIWAYLHQTQIVESRIDANEVKFEIQRLEFDKQFAQVSGLEVSPYVEERLQMLYGLLEELEARRAAQRATMDDATAAVEAELRRYERSDGADGSGGSDATPSGSQQPQAQASAGQSLDPGAVIDAELRLLDQ